MIPWMETVSLLLLLAAAWFWFDSFQARAAALRAARAACVAEDLLLLDDTVALVGLRPARDDVGRLHLRRVYDFEYSDTGNNRRPGQVTLLASELLLLRLAPAPGAHLRLVGGRVVPEDSGPPPRSP